MKVIKVNLWKKNIGYLSENDNGVCGFQYDRDFLNSGIELSPLMMPLSERTYTFPALSRDTFHGLPGMFADSLPDKFGNMVIREYLSEKGIALEDISVVDRLCFTGTRAMGALEYEPAKIEVGNDRLDIDSLKNIADLILSQRKEIIADENSLTQLFQSSSSAGGARAKALVAFNENTREFRSGQIDAGEGFEYWLLKFDGIGNNKDKDTQPDKQGYTNIEYAYYLMARDCGINMTECRLYKNNNLQHFMTKRFDRESKKYGKIHMQSLGGIAHYDFNDTMSNSYENAFRVLRKLNLPYNDFKELFMRMVYNVVMVNCDDHVKNVSFLMDRKGRWSLSPAYDLTFSYNPKNRWLKAHQMSINGKDDGITMKDLLTVAENEDIKKSDAKEIIERIQTVNDNWYSYSEQAEVNRSATDTVKKIFEEKKLL